MAERANTEGLLSENNYRLLDEIRRQRTSDKTKLASASGFSWPTVNKLCEELKNSGYLSKETSLLDPTVGYMLGVAVGTREIKVRLSPPSTINGAESTGINSAKIRRWTFIPLPVDTSVSFQKRIRQNFWWNRQFSKSGQLQPH